MNTPTPLAAFAGILTDLCARISHDINPSRWEHQGNYTPQDIRDSVDAKMRAIPIALAEMGDRLNIPTKKHLRSHLSIGSPLPVIEGFDDLYDEVVTLVGLNQLKDDDINHDILIARYQDALARIERMKVAESNLRLSFQSHSDDLIREAAALREELDNVRKANDATAAALDSSRKMNRVKDNRIIALEAKVDELSKLPKKQHWDDGPPCDSSIAEHKGLPESHIRKIVEDILKEFKIESPTNSIADMVRAACEFGAAQCKAVPERNYAGGVPRLAELEGNGSSTTCPLETPEYLSTGDLSSLDEDEDGTPKRDSFSVAFLAISANVALGAIHLAVDILK